MASGFIYPPRPRASGKSTDLIIHLWMDMFEHCAPDEKIKAYFVVTPKHGQIRHLSERFLEFVRNEGENPSDVSASMISFEWHPLFRKRVFFMGVDGINFVRGWSIQGLYVDNYYDLTSMQRQNLHNTALPYAKSYIFV